MEFMDVIESRRSVRSFSDKQVEDEKIVRIMECARLAPSWANKQCWHFIVLSNRKRIEEVSDP